MDCRAIKKHILNITSFAYRVIKKATVIFGSSIKGAITYVSKEYVALDISKLFYSILITVVLGLILWLVYTRPFLISSFAVPAELESRGYSGQYLAQQLRDEISVIRDKVDARKPTEGALLSEHDLPTFYTSTNSFSLHAIANYLRNIFGFEQTTIEGMLVKDNNSYTLILTFNDGKIFKRIFSIGKINFESVQEVLEKAAEEAIEHFEPYIIAVHSYYKGDYERTNKMIRLILESHDDVDKIYAHNLTALILEQEAEAHKNNNQPDLWKSKLTLAKNTYQIIQSLYPSHTIENEFAFIMTNYARILVKLREKVEARNLLEPLLDRYPTCPEALIELAVLNADEGQYIEAIENYKTVLKIIESSDKYDYGGKVYIEPLVEELTNALLTEATLMARRGEYDAAKALLDSGMPYLSLLPEPSKLRFMEIQKKFRSYGSTVN